MLIFDQIYLSALPNSILNTETEKSVYEYPESPLWANLIQT